MADAAAWRHRRSCRSFRPDSIDDELLVSVIGAARSAPRAGNAAALEFVVLTGHEQTAAYWDVTLPGERRERFVWPRLLDAWALVIPLVRPSAYVERYAERDKAHSGLGAGESAWNVPYWWVDGGAAVMAVLSAATEAGLGSLFFGQFAHEEALAQRFGIPEGFRALGTIALGWPDGNDRPSLSSGRSRPSIESTLHRGGW